MSVTSVRMLRPARRELSCKLISQSILSKKLIEDVQCSVVMCVDGCVAPDLELLRVRKLWEHFQMIGHDDRRYYYGLLRKCGLVPFLISLLIHSLTNTKQ